MSAVILFPIILVVAFVCFVLWCALRTGAMAERQAEEWRELEQQSKPRIINK